MEFALSGTHCGGKTTALWKTGTLLKENGFDNFTMIQEVARGCLYPINELGNFGSVNWILLKHILTEYEAYRRGWTHLICDRSVFDEYVYFKVSVLERLRNDKINLNETIVLDQMLGYIRVVAEQWAGLFPYETIFLFDALPLASDPDRSDSVAYQQQVDDCFKQYFKDWPNVVQVKGRGRTTRAEFVANKILEALQDV